jgi:hypothetical protein
MPKFLIEQEIAEIVRCSVSKLRADRWLRRGMPYIRLGRSILYDEQDVLRFLDSRRVKTTEAAK